MPWFWTPVIVLLAAQLGAQAQAPAPALRVEREIVLRGGSCTSLAWSADGSWIAAGGGLGDVLVVEVNTGHVVHELVGPDRGTVGAVRFAPDRSALFVAGRELTRWSLATGESTARVEIAYPHTMVLSRDGRRVAYAQSKDIVIVANADDLRTQRELKLAGDAAIDGLAFDPTGERLALERGGRTCRFSLATGEQVPTRDEPLWVKALAYRDDGRLVRLDWRGRLLGFTDEEHALCYCARSMSVDARASLCVTWDDKEVRGLTHDGTTFAVAGGGPAAVHPHGAIWARVYEGQLEVHRGAECVHRVPVALRRGPDHCVFLRDGRHLAFSGGETKLFDLERGAFVPLACPLAGNALPYPGGDELALWQVPNATLGPAPATLTFWSISALLAGGTEPARTHTFAEVDTRDAPVFSRDGRHFALGDTIRATRQPDVILWSVPAHYGQWLQPAVGGQAAWRVSSLPDCTSLGSFTIQRCRADGAHDAEQTKDDCYMTDWSPDGTRMIVNFVNEVRVVEGASMQTIATLPSNEFTTWKVATWLDDERLLVLSEGGQLAIVSAATGAELARTQVPAQYGYFTVAADGKRCAVAMNDRVVVVRVTP